MSYSSGLRDTLIRYTEDLLGLGDRKCREKPCCLRALHSGLCLFSPAKSRNGSAVLTARIEELLKKKRPVFRPCTELSDILQCEDCFSRFCLGVFLSAGNMQDPEKRYHLEIIAPSLSFAEWLHRELCRRELEAHLTERRQQWVICLKESEKIEDFLTMIGAQQKALEMMEMKVEKSLKNQINRTTNCEKANISRTVQFAGELHDAILLLKSHHRYDRLPESVKKTAALRQKYPSASLTELCSLSEEPLTKSGLNHRLNKILEEARVLKEELGQPSRAKGDPV